MTFLNPKSIALVGASTKTFEEVLAEGKYWGAALRDSLLQSHTEDIPLYFITKHESYTDLPETPDLAIVAVPNIIEEVTKIVNKGTDKIIVINTLDVFTERKLYKIVKNKATILGPNCLGVHCDAYSTFFLGRKTTGDIGLVTQSGGIGEALLENVPNLRTVISVGSAQHYRIEDAIQSLREEPNIKRIALYSESYIPEDEDVITLMPKYSKASVEAVYDHTGLTLEKNNAINNLHDFIKVLNEKVLVVSNSGGWLCLYAGQNPNQNMILVDTYATGNPLQKAIEMQSGYTRAVIFFNKHEDFPKKDLDDSKLLIPHKIIKSSNCETYI
jgi:succinyl-CoA synthetase alpha subunit